MIAERDIDARIAQLKDGYGLKYQGHRGPVSLRPVCVRDFPMLLEFCNGSKKHGQWLWIEEDKLRQLFQDCPPIRKLPKAKRFKSLHNRE